MENRALSGSLRLDDRSTGNHWLINTLHAFGVDAHLSPYAVAWRHND
jgi:hypothetical protein